MPKRVLALAGLYGLIAGGCLPLYQNKHQAIPGEVLGISVSTDEGGQTVADGTLVDVTWSAANLTDEPATVTITAESRTDLSLTVLADGLTFAGIGSGAQHVLWDTTGFAGPYSIRALITTASLQRESSASGLITVDAAPQFTFTAPTTDVTFRPSTDSPLTIAWEGGDESATFRIGLDVDSNHNNQNEVYIDEGDLPTTLSADSFDWNGLDTSGQSVPVGEYQLFATATDSVNATVTVEAGVTITVAE